MLRLCAEACTNCSVRSLSKLFAKLSLSKGHFSCVDSLSLILVHGKYQTYSCVVKAKWTHFRVQKAINEHWHVLWFPLSCANTHFEWNPMYFAALLHSKMILHFNECILYPLHSLFQRWPPTSFCLFLQFLNSSEGPLLRRRRHLDSSRPYIAAKLLSLPTTFTLGDKKNYSGFYNKPLNIDQEYLSFVMAVLQNNVTDSTANYVR